MEAEAQASPDPPAPEVHHYTTSPRLYVKIFVFLVVITSIEVALSYSFDIFGRFTVAMLFVAAAVKFVLVVGFYMHLRYESPVLTRFFGSGLALAAALYAIVLGMFGVLGIVFG